MNYSPAQPAISISRPLSGRVVDGFSESLRTAARAIHSYWRNGKIHRDELRAFDSIAHLNEHILKDIGAPDRLMARAAAQREAQDLRWIEFDFR